MASTESLADGCQPRWNFLLQNGFDSPARLEDTLGSVKWQRAARLVAWPQHFQQDLLLSLTWPRKMILSGVLQQKQERGRAWGLEEQVRERTGAEPTVQPYVYLLRHKPYCVQYTGNWVQDCSPRLRGGCVRWGLETRGLLLFWQCQQLRTVLRSARKVAELVHHQVAIGHVIAQQSTSSFLRSRGRVLGVCIMTFCLLAKIQHETNSTKPTSSSLLLLNKRIIYFYYRFVCNTQLFWK